MLKWISVMFAEIRREYARLADALADDLFVAELRARPPRRLSVDRSNSTLFAVPNWSVRLGVYVMAPTAEKECVPEGDTQADCAP